MSATRHAACTLVFSRPIPQQEKAMADTKDKVKENIDKAAEKAKEWTDKSVDKGKETARKVGDKMKEAGEKVREQGE